MQGRRAVRRQRPVCAACAATAHRTGEFRALKAWQVQVRCLPAHKGTAIRALVEARGGTLLSYSPDLNPIELVFAKLKHLLRSAADSIDRLWTALGDCLRKFIPDECSRYLRHCGYGNSV